MSRFSKRTINRKTLQIIRDTGRVIACYQQISGFANEATNRVPTDPYADNEAPLDANYKKFFIFGVFEQTIPQEFAAEGSVSNIIGTITVPRIYATTLRVTAYFDPYLNGSKFVKVGAAIDDEDLLIIQNVKALYIPQMPEVI